MGNMTLLALYDAFFAGPEVEVLELSSAVIEKATDLRAALNGCLALGQCNRRRSDRVPDRG
jgi:hypothetical protein